MMSWHNADKSFFVNSFYWTAALENGWSLRSRVRFTSNHDPDKAMASRKQHDKRRYRLEFKVHTFQYKVE
ncbi:MAG: hypothetical protein AB4426_25120 [Xenococcaceae cyanobacterium]